MSFLQRSATLHWATALAGFSRDTWPTRFTYTCFFKFAGTWHDDPQAPPIPPGSPVKGTNKWHWSANIDLGNKLSTLLNVATTELYEHGYNTGGYANWRWSLWSTLRIWDVLSAKTQCSTVPRGPLFFAEEKSSVKVALTTDDWFLIN